MCMALGAIERSCRIDKYKHARKWLIIIMLMCGNTLHECLLLACIP